MLDRWADLPHTVPLNHCLDLARETVRIADIPVSEEHLLLLTASILCGFAIAGGMDDASRDSMKAAAQRWLEMSPGAMQ